MVQRRGIFASGCALAVFTSVAFAPTATAQESDGASEAEARDDSIIVTATRKEERLRDIPLAVSALPTPDSWEWFGETGAVGGIKPLHV